MEILRKLRVRLREARNMSAYHCQSFSALKKSAAPMLTQKSFARAQFFQDLAFALKMSQICAHFEIQAGCQSNRKERFFARRQPFLGKISLIFQNSCFKSLIDFKFLCFIGIFIYQD